MRITAAPHASRSLTVFACILWLGCAGGDDDSSGCPPLSDLFETRRTFDPSGNPIDSNGNPNNLESITFVDRNGDGLFDSMDTFDFDMDGVPDDFNGDGFPDNRFYFNDAGDFIPDADSFDDFEDPGLGIPRGVTPVPGDCPADGIATGPLDLFGQDGRPMFASFKPSKCCRRPMR